MIDFDTERNKRLQQRYDFLTELRDLMERHNAEIECVIVPKSDGEWTAEVEVYVDYCSNLCGSRKDRLDISGVCQMLNDAAEQVGKPVR